MRKAVLSGSGDKVREQASGKQADSARAVDRSGKIMRRAKS
jgi:hypothetical protein